MIETIGSIEKSLSFAQDDSISPGEALHYNKLKTQLDKVSKNLFSERQKLAGMLPVKPRGAYIREFDIHRSRRDYLLKKFETDCRVRGGGCDRDCGCCGRFTEVPPNMIPSKELGKKMHCPVDCACCVRARGFTSREVREEETREADEDTSQND